MSDAVIMDSVWRNIFQNDYHSVSISILDTPYHIINSAVGRQGLKPGHLLIGIRLAHQKGAKFVVADSFSGK